MTDEMWLELAKGQFRFADNPTEEELNAKVQELKQTKLIQIMLKHLANKNF